MRAAHPRRFLKTLPKVQLAAAAAEVTAPSG